MAISTFTVPTGFSECYAVVQFFGPQPYLSSADIPIGFFASGFPDFLEDFEDGSLDGGITATPALNSGARLGSSFGSILIDSVDADDGLINGFSHNDQGHYGESYWAPAAVSFTFPNPLPTAAGLVWTDGGTSGEQVTFRAFGSQMEPLGTFGPFPIGDSNNLGETAEDRFFGVKYSGGIKAISLTPLIGAMEIDHLQYGDVLPEPSTLHLFVLGLLLRSISSRRR